MAPLCANKPPRDPVASRTRGLGQSELEGLIGLAWLQVRTWTVRRRLVFWTVQGLACGYWFGLPRPSIDLPHVAAWAEALLLGLIGQMGGDELHVGAGTRCRLHRQLSENAATQSEATAEDGTAPVGPGLDLSGGSFTASPLSSPARCVSFSLSSPISPTPQ